MKLLVHTSKGRQILVINDPPITFYDREMYDQYEYLRSVICSIYNIFSFDIHDIEQVHTYLNAEHMLVNVGYSYKEMGE